MDNKPGEAQVVADTEANAVKASDARETGDDLLGAEEKAENGNLLDSNNAQEVGLTLENKTHKDDAAEDTNPDGTEVEADDKPHEHGIHELTASEEKVPNGRSSQTNNDQSSTSTSPLQEEDVLHTVSNLKHLENKIVDIDGHFSSKDIGSVNAWKSFRGIRNNQDMGTLFEMRDDFYVYKHPQIVKEAKKKT